MGGKEYRGRISSEFRDRTKQFAAGIIRLNVRLPKNREEVSVCGKQLLRAETSVAAHVHEASCARSKAEFCSRLGGANQEADGAEIWLELLREDGVIDGDLAIPLEKEADKLIAFMTTMIRRTSSRP